MDLCFIQFPLLGVIDLSVCEGGTPLLHTSGRKRDEKGDTENETGPAMKEAAPNSRPGLRVGLDAEEALGDAGGGGGDGEGEGVSSAGTGTGSQARIGPRAVSEGVRAPESVSPPRHRTETEDEISVVEDGTGDLEYSTIGSVAEGAVEAAWRTAMGSFRIKAG